MIKIMTKNNETKLQNKYKNKEEKKILKILQLKLKKFVKM